MKKIQLAVVVFAVTLLAACGKDDPQPSVAERLVAKWNLNSVVNTDFTVNPPVVTSQNLTNTTLEFKNNGKLYISFGGIVDSSTYTVLSDKYIFSDGDSLEITTLTSNALQLKTVYRNMQGVIEEEDKLNCSK